MQQHSTSAKAIKRGLVAMMGLDWQGTSATVLYPNEFYGQLVLEPTSKLVATELHFMKSYARF